MVKDRENGTGMTQKTVGSGPCLGHLMPWKPGILPNLSEPQSLYQHKMENYSHPFFFISYLEVQMR